MAEYIPRHKYRALTKKQQETIFLRVYRKKSVAQFIKDCGVPTGAYYQAISGKDIKATHIKKIVAELKKY